MVGDYQREEGRPLAVFRVETLQEGYLEHVEVKLKVLKAVLLTDVCMNVRTYIRVLEL